MQPYEIKPDTALCTILGYNAQTGYSRKFFNKILKHNSINATAIALNITDEHFDFTLSNVANSKVDKMIIEQEFQKKVLPYCDILDDVSIRENRVDFIEIRDGKIYGFCLADKRGSLFKNAKFLDEQILFISQMMILANIWFDAKIDIDDIPLLTGDKI